MQSPRPCEVFIPSSAAYYAFCTAHSVFRYNLFIRESIFANRERILFYDFCDCFDSVGLN